MDSWSPLAWLWNVQKSPPDYRELISVWHSACPPDSTTIRASNPLS